MTQEGQGVFTHYHKGSVNKFDFYSGSQITVWFGDILIDDINSIQWERSQNKMPLYGYASQHLDAVANGTVLIQGEFVINFRTRGYISLILNEIKRLYSQFNDSQNWSEIRKYIGLHLKNGTFGPKTADEIRNIGDSPDFMKLAKAYEDIVWGGGVPVGDDDKVDEDFDRVDPYPPDIKQANDIPDGFNILITYGNPSQTEARTLLEEMQSTTKTLIGVHLLGESQVIQVGGQPTLERYRFLARDTDEYIGTTR